MRTITIRLLKAMGDVLYAEPVIRALKTQCDLIHFHTEYPFLFENYPKVIVKKCDRKLPKPTPPNYINLQSVYVNNFWDNNDFKYVTSCYLEHLSNLQFEHSEIDLRPQIHMTKAEIKWAANVLVRGKYMVVDVGYKHIMNFETEIWNSLFDKLKKIGWKIVVIGTSEGHCKNNQKLRVDLDLRGKTNGRQLLAIIHQSDFFLGVESGPFVVAMSFDKEGILLSGITQTDLILLPDSKITPISCCDGIIKGHRTLRYRRKPSKRKHILNSLYFPEEEIMGAL